MNVVRVSALEAFRRWRNDEDSSVDDLFHVPETEAMRVGTALHKALELSSTGMFDVLSFGGYRFQIDGIVGRTVYDYKTTGIFNAERYLDGYQWRYYLDIFGLDVFRWLVFVIEPDRYQVGTYIVRDFHRLETGRYGALHEDCAALARDFQDFLSRANGTKGQNND